MWTMLLIQQGPRTYPMDPDDTPTPTNRRPGARRSGPKKKPKQQVWWKRWAKKRWVQRWAQRAILMVLLAFLGWACEKEAGPVPKFMCEGASMVRRALHMEDNPHARRSDEDDPPALPVAP